MVSFSFGLSNVHTAIIFHKQVLYAMMQYFTAGLNRIPRSTLGVLHTLCLVNAAYCVYLSSVPTLGTKIIPLP